MKKLLALVLLLSPCVVSAQTQHDRVRSRGQSTFDSLANTQTVTMTGATPDVSGGNIFKTSNGGTTTVTNFLNGHDAQAITVVCGDTNTTIQNNANIVMVSGGNFTCTSLNAAVQFVFLASAWIQDGGANSSGVGFTTEPANTVFAANPPSPIVNTFTNSGAQSTEVIVSGAPTQAPALALLLTSGLGVSGSPGAGWTQIVTDDIFYQLVTNTNSVTGDRGLAGNAVGWASILTFLNSNGSAPSAVHLTSGNNSCPGNGRSVNIGPFTPAAGSSIVVNLVFSSNGSFSSPFTITLHDSQGNVYAQIAAPVFQSGATGTQTISFIARNVPGASTTIAVSQIAGAPQGNVGFSFAVVTLTNLIQASPGLPSFMLLTSPQIPPLDASQIASGLLALTQGGTAADLSATGGS